MEVTKCGNCETLFQGESSKITTILSTWNTGKGSENSSSSSAPAPPQKISIYEALSVVFEIAPLGSGEYSKKELFQRGSKFRAYIQQDQEGQVESRDEEEGGYALCWNCSEMLTVLYNCLQDFITACKGESEVGKILKELECLGKEGESSDKGRHPKSNAPDDGVGLGRRQDTNIIVKSEPVESDDDNDENIIPGGDYNDQQPFPFSVGSTDVGGSCVNVKQQQLQENSSDEDNGGDDSRPSSPQLDVSDNENNFSEGDGEELNSKQTRVLRPRRNATKRISKDFVENLEGDDDSDEEKIKSKRKTRSRFQDSDEEFVPSPPPSNKPAFVKPNITSVSSISKSNLQSEEGGASITTLTCPQCGKQFLHENTLTCHRRIVHRENIALKPLSLPLPLAQRNTGGNRVTVESGKTSTCPVCRVELPRNEIRAHLSSHTRSLSRPWMCTVCGRECSSSENLFQHMKNHRGNIPCKRCGKNVPRLEMLNHMRHCLKRIGTGNIPCKFCAQTFGSSLQVMEHRSRVHGHVWKCQICGSKFSRRDTMVEHMQVHRKKKAYKCKICDKAYDRTDVLRLHVKRFHRNDGPPSVAKDPALETGDDLDVGTETQIHTKEKAYKCKKCDKAYDRLEILRLHMKRFHRPSSVLEVDDDFNDGTGSPMPSPTDSPSHETPQDVPEGNSLLEDRYICKACDSSFPIQSMLESHLVEMHTDKDKPKCTVCNREFQDAYCLSLHLKIHSETKSIQCFICCKSYRDKNTLFYHVKESHKIPVKTIIQKYPDDFAVNMKDPSRPLAKRRFLLPKKNAEKGEFPCEICGKVFSYELSVKTHIRIVHDKVKDFICSYCGKGFARKSYFLVHEKLHTTTDSPYKCHKCDKAFRLPGNLRQHLKSTIHNPEKNYVCEVCGKGFNRMDNMKLHVKAVHLKIQIRKPRNQSDPPKPRKRLSHVDDNYVPNLPAAEIPGTSKGFPQFNADTSSSSLEPGSSDSRTSYYQDSSQQNQQQRMTNLHMPIREQPSRSTDPNQHSTDAYSQLNSEYGLRSFAPYR